MNIKLTALYCAATLFYTTLYAENNEKPEEPSTTEFVILIASYNNEQYCERNLASVVWQKSSRPFQVIVINDCSTDKTAERLNEFVRNNNLESRVTLIHNSERYGSLKNIYTTLHTLVDDHKVVVSVDGDDQLISDSVLLRLEQEYKNPSIHLTYGSFIQSSTGRRGKARKIPDEIIRTRRVRKLTTFKAHHLKTFRAGLFKKIKKEDLMLNENFFSATGDLAFMYPMIEMLAPVEENEPDHTAFIREILYKHNDENPINDFRIHRKKQQFFRRYIRRQKPYEPLDKKIFLTNKKRKTRKKSKELPVKVYQGN
ncbi:glycosyltransferase family 2 protein [Candidatus Dependentiae bacterium]|nr:glycosyltransferase family 2 protein [Candidatus Dependentiae bacterium]